MITFRFNRLSAPLTSALKIKYPAFNASLLSERIEPVSIHTTNVRYKFGPSKPRPTVYKKPVDWLPFPWHRRRRFNLFEQSGDAVKEVIVDLSRPKPDFELSEELKTASETVKRKYSLSTGTKTEKKEVFKRDLLKRIQRHPFDFDSLEVKIALKTLQIQSMYEHYRDFHRVEKRFNLYVFPMLIQKRYTLLNLLYKIDKPRLEWLLKELQLEFKPPTYQVKTERYCKKMDLRRMTREYCAKVVADKKAVYHEELKKEQQAFLQEKKEALEWIAAEEKALNSGTVS